MVAGEKILFVFGVYSYSLSIFTKRVYSYYSFMTQKTMGKVMMNTSLNE